MNDKLRAMVDAALSKVGCGYIYGATGWICSEARRKQQAAQYPEYAANILGVGAKWDGKQCFDCAQLSKFAANAGGLSLPSGATSQWNSNSWTTKGMLTGIPSEPCLVFRQVNNGIMQHVGVYIGDGWCVDARGTTDGVIKSRFDSYKWSHFALPDLGHVGGVSGFEPPFTARVKTTTGKGISLWIDNKKLDRVATIPEGGVVTVVGHADYLGFAMSDFDRKRGVADTQYLIPLDSADTAAPASMASAASTAGTTPAAPTETLPIGDQEAWRKAAAAYALLAEAANIIGDSIQDFGS